MEENKDLIDGRATLATLETLVYTMVHETRCGEGETACSSCSFAPCSEYGYSPDRIALEVGDGITEIVRLRGKIREEKEKTMENQTVTLSLEYYTSLVERAITAEMQLENMSTKYWALYAENKALKETKPAGEGESL